MEIKWMATDGSLIKVSDMTDQHLKHAISFVEDGTNQIGKDNHNLAEYYGWTVGSAHKGIAARNGWIMAFKNEQERRKEEECSYEIY